jgi:hypothetical protein
VNYSGGWTQANASGYYEFYLVPGWTGTITPVKTGFYFTPALRTVTTPVNNDLTGQNFTTTPITYTISGNVGLAGVRLTYFVNGYLRAGFSDRYGNYSLIVPYNWSGTVTPSMMATGKNSLVRYFVSPSSRTYTNVLSNRTGQNYMVRRVH